MSHRRRISAKYLVAFVLLVGCTASPASTRPSLSTATVAAATAAPTVQTPKPTPTPEPSPVVLSGKGDFATDPVKLTFVANVTLTHAGARNFIVYENQGTARNLLVNTIGPYQGTRPLWAEGQTLDGPRTFEIKADGAWTLTMTPIKCCATDGAFAGHGDAVSTSITTTDTSSKPWEISHTGTRNFIVYLRCDTGSNLVVNKIGAYSGSALVSLSKSFCIWDVRADGDWSIKPR
jgi:hypothetical protein